MSELVRASEEFHKEQVRLEAFGEEKGLRQGRYVADLGRIYLENTKFCNFFLTCRYLPLPFEKKTHVKRGKELNKDVHSSIQSITSQPKPQFKQS
jgi:hypothetical protein